MTLFSPNPTHLNCCCPRQVPGWVARLFDAPLESDPCESGLLLSADRAWSLARVVINSAEAMDDDAIRQETQHAYQQLLSHIRQSAAPYPVRGWNAIPSIGRSIHPGRDRYMAFNAGRFAAYQSFFKDMACAVRQMPTASAVGHDHHALTISLLGHHQPGRAIENPRQVPAFRYSDRYGPIAPSFVRATVLADSTQARTVLVAGTASVVGEDSLHAGDLHQQLDETYRNLATVLLASADRDINPQAMTIDRQHDCLQRYRSARVYFRRPEDLQAVSDSVRHTMKGLSEVEWVVADICRPELLVEIEGVAELHEGGLA